MAFLLFFLLQAVFAQTCEVQVSLVCDGVEVPIEPDGSYDLAATCDVPLEDTGDTDGTDTDGDTGIDTDTGMFGDTGISYVPDYAHGPYTSGDNVFGLLGQSLVCGPSPDVDWWPDTDTGDTGVGPEPLIVGYRFEPGGNSGSAWGDLRGPEIGILTDRWAPEMQVQLLCYGMSLL